MGFLLCYRHWDQYQKEYQKAVDSCGDYTKYTNVDSYENLINIKEDIIKKKHPVRALISQLLVRILCVTRPINLFLLCYVLYN